MQQIKLVIVDDIAGIRRHFRSVLEEYEDIEIVGEASSGIEAYEVVKKIKPDIVLMDIQMETDSAGIHAIERIKATMDDVKIIVLTIHEEDEKIFSAYGAGANDYLTKTAGTEEIVKAIRDVYKNQLHLRPQIAEKILGEFSRIRNERSSMVYTLNIMSKLTNSEYEILRAIYDGQSYKVIAKQRFVEESTIKKQANMILKKFEKQKMKEVVRLLKELGIFEIYL